MTAFGCVSARERVAVRAVRGGEDVAVLQRLADADGDGLLADRDVEEAGQLARAEALLDLLLEAPDEQHLAQEVAQRLLGQRRLVSRPWPRPQCRARSRSRVDEPGRTVARGRGRASRRLGRGAGSRCAVADDRRRPRAAALLGPAHAGSLRRHVPLLSGAAAGRRVPGGRRARCSRGSTTSGSAASSSSSRRDLAAAVGRRRATTARVGLAGPSSRRCRPTGATLWARSSFESTDYVERAALLLAPLNPARTPDGFALPLPRRAPRRATAPRPRWSPLPRAPRRAGDPGLGRDPPRALRHGARPHAGPGLVRRREGRVTTDADPVS